MDSDYGRFWSLDHAGIARLVAGAGVAAWTSDPSARSRFADDLRNAAVARPLARQDVLVNLGPFWPARYGDKFEAHISTSGCRLTSFVYDLIPIDHPELCDARTVRLFNAALPRLLRMAEHIIAISQHTKRRLEAFAAGQVLTLPTIDVAPLAHGFTEHGDDAGVSTKPAGLPEMANGFALCVGTVEPRKNHLRLAEAWARLDADIARMPTLLIAGKLGWLDPAQYGRIRELGSTARRIVFLHDLSDDNLKWLYQNCLFTVLLSLDEGWGLPLGESLTFGKVCLAAETGALPEVAGGLAEYSDPRDPDAIFRALHSLIVNSGRRHALEERIRREFRPRTWPDVSRDLVTAIDGL